MSSGHLAATQRSCIQPAQFLACGHDLTSNPAVVSAPVLVYPDRPRIKVDAQCRTAMLRVLHCEYAISAVDAEIGVTTHAVLHFVCLLCQRAGIRQRGESDAIDDGFRQSAGCVRIIWSCGNMYYGLQPGGTYLSTRFDEGIVLGFI